jgi:hypothetical protein
MKNKIFLIIVALSISISQFYQSKNACLRDTGNSFSSKYKTFIGFNAWGYEKWVKTMAPLYRNRTFSLVGASWYCSLFKDTVSTEGFKNRFVEKFPVRINGQALEITSCRPVRLYDAIASWNAGWLFLSLLLIIFAVKKNTLLWLFAMSAGVLFAWNPMARGIIYPYDGAALFFWTFIVLTGMSKKYRYWIFPAVIIGTGFKETIVVAGLVPLLWFDLPVRQRVKLFLICCGGACAMKLILSIAVQATPFFTMQLRDTLLRNFHEDPKCALQIIKNIGYLIHPTLDYPLFVIGGMLAGLFMLPNKKIIVGWKFIAGVFISNLMVFGIITEYRVWHEMIPVFLWCYNYTKE